MAFFAILPAHGQQVQVYFSADSVAVGDRFALTVAVDHDFSSAPSFPSRHDDAFGDVEVLSLRTAGRSSVGISFAHRDSVVYEATTFALDSAALPPLAVSFDGGAVTINTDSLFLPILSLVPEDTSSIRGMASLVGFGNPLWPYLLLCLAVAAALGLWYYYLRHRSKPVVLEASPPPEGPSPYEKACMRMKRLQAASVDTADAARLYHIELSDIMRTYLEERLDIPARERTTRELREELAHPLIEHKMPGGGSKHVENILRRTDLVKFADFFPPAPESRGMMEETQELLERIEAKLHQIAMNQEWYEEKYPSTE